VNGGGGAFCLAESDHIQTAASSNTNVPSSSIEAVRSDVTASKLLVRSVPMLRRLASRWRWGSAGSPADVCFIECKGCFKKVA
jgi:hypothetical protein